MCVHACAVSRLGTSQFIGDKLFISSDELILYICQNQKESRAFLKNGTPTLPDQHSVF